MLLAGGNVFLTDAQIFELTRQGRLACGIGEPCRIVEGEPSRYDTLGKTERKDAATVY